MPSPRLVSWLQTLDTGAERLAGRRWSRRSPAGEVGRTCIERSEMEGCVFHKLPMSATIYRRPLYLIGDSIRVTPVSRSN